MSAFTASLALAIVQFCSGLIMVGVSLSTPRERFPRYWALSGALSAASICVLIVVHGGGSVSFDAGLLLGNTGLFGSSIAAWSGLRNFYLRPARRWAWALVAVYALSFGIMLAQGADYTQRSYLAIGAMQGVFLLVLREFLMGFSGPQGRRHARLTFGRGMGITAMALFSVCYLSRLGISATRPELFEPPAIPAVGVLLIYLIPLGASLLFSSSLLVVYFESIVADKQRLATEDELTGTLNRRALLHGGEQALRAALAGKHSLTLAFIDVDHFKQINDRFGHVAGDQVLADIAAVLRANCREDDLLGRYGGEEFCAVFPGLSQTETDRIGERLVEAVGSHAFSHGQRVTISVGVAVLQPGQAQTWDTLVRQADLALYRAKSEGRNAFRIAHAA